MKKALKWLVFVGIVAFVIWVCVTSGGFVSGLGTLASMLGTILLAALMFGPFIAIGWYLYLFVAKPVGAGQTKLFSKTVKKKQP